MIEQLTIYAHRLRKHWYLGVPVIPFVLTNCAPQPPAIIQELQENPTPPSQPNEFTAIMMQPGKPYQVTIACPAQAEYFDITWQGIDQQTREALVDFTYYTINSQQQPQIIDTATLRFQSGSSQFTTQGICTDHQSFNQIGLQIDLAEFIFNPFTEQLEMRIHNESELEQIPITI